MRSHRLTPMSRCPLLLVGLVVLTSACSRIATRMSEWDYEHDVERTARAAGVGPLTVSCQASTTIRDEGRCVATASSSDLDKLVAAQRFESRSPGRMRTYAERSYYAGGCGSLVQGVDALVVHAYGYQPGVSPRTAWNEIWYLPASHLVRPFRLA
jgi:hypothetical protein